MVAISIKCFVNWVGDAKVLLSWVIRRHYQLSFSADRDHSKKGSPCSRQVDYIHIVWFFTINVFPGNQLERLVQQDDWQRYLKHCPPFLHRQRRDREHSLHGSNSLGQFNGHTIRCKTLTFIISTWRRTKWRPNDMPMADNNHRFVHGGIIRSDWFSDKLEEHIIRTVQTSSEPIKLTC